MSSPQELDGGIDETDRDQTEAELATAIAALLAAKAAGAPWLDLVRGSLSGIVRDFLRRATYDMAISAGLSPTDAVQAADEAVDATLGDVEQHLASWLRIAAEDRAPEVVKPDGTPGPKDLSKSMDRENADQASGIIARTITTYSREKARGAIAEKLGATKRRWQTRMDSRVRPLHKQLEGQWKPLGKPFKAGGVELQYPGDPAAPLDATAGCRCHLIWLVK